MSKMNFQHSANMVRGWVLGLKIGINGVTKEDWFSVVDWYQSAPVVRWGTIGLIRASACVAFPHLRGALSATVVRWRA